MSDSRRPITPDCRLLTRPKCRSRTHNSGAELPVERRRCRAPNESSLCQECLPSLFVGASVRPVVPVVVALLAGPGVASPKNRLSGCETGHAGFESFLLALPGPR